MLTLLTAMATSASAQDLSGLISLLVDTGTPRTWQEKMLPGTVCGNGTPYRFYVHENNSSVENVLFYFEGGGACWTYEGCTGLAGTLSAANPNGIPPNYMTGLQQEYASPLVNGADPGLPGRSRTDLFTKDWNVVFLPYCTGDVHIGNKANAVYTDPVSGASITYQHNGYNNTQAVIGWVDNKWADIKNLMVSGYSAGGTGTAANYYFIREALSDNMQGNGGRGYYLNDSGPLYPAPNANSNSRQLHDTITQEWNLNNVFANIPASLKTPANPNGFDSNDYGTLNRAVATNYPTDRFAYTAFSMDFNYSRFSYENFPPNPSPSQILQKWQDDQDDLVTLLDTLPNFSYHLPWERSILDSHTVTTVTFIGSHACEQMEKKRYWWEYLQWPWGQTYKCYSEFLPVETFLDRWYTNGTRSRILEPQNGYNDEDPGMQLITALVNAAL